MNDPTMTSTRHPASQRSGRVQANPRREACPHTHFSRDNALLSLDAAAMWPDRFGAPRPIDAWERHS